MDREDESQPINNMTLTRMTSDLVPNVRNKCDSESSNTSLSTTFLDQISEEDFAFQDYVDNGSISHSQTSGDCTFHIKETYMETTSMADDERNHNVLYNRPNYLTLTFTNDVVENTKVSREDLRRMSSFEEGEKSTGDYDITLTCNSTNSLNRTNKHLCAKEELEIKSNEYMGKFSPMDISSPDSIKSFEDGEKRECKTFPMPNICQTPLFRFPGAGSKLIHENQKLDLDIENSSESAEETSNTIDCVWDEERYLSEHNYVEQVDEERTRNIVNFGDDYRNFIDSLSDNFSSVPRGNIQRKQRSKRITRRKKEENKHPYDTCSEHEVDNLTQLKEDSLNTICKINKRILELESDELVSKESLNDYNDFLLICSDNLVILKCSFHNEDLQDSFVTRKKNREIRILVNSWEKLQRQIRENMNHTEMYDALKNNVLTLKVTLTNISKNNETLQHHQNGDGYLEFQLQTFEETLTDLSQLKSKLFELNLSVHNFLAKLNSSNGGKSQIRFQRSVDLKDEVTDLYKLWDKTHHQVAGSIAKTEITLKKLKSFEIEVLELRNTFKQDAKVIKEKGYKNKVKRIGTKSMCSLRDSGISDDSAFFTDSDFPAREKHLSKLRLMAKGLEHNFPTDSAPMMIIQETLQSTSEEFNCLKTKFKKYKTVRAPKQKKQIKPNISKNHVPKKKNTFIKTPQHKRVIKMSVIMNFMLFLTAMLLFNCNPDCCDSFNTMRFSPQPQFKYVNGPPPI